MKRRGFTLLEMLVAVALVCVVMVLLFGIISTATTGMRKASDRTTAYRGAREAFDVITRSLSQATLDTYYDYYDGSRRSRQEMAKGGDLASFQPDVYGRYSDLHFVSGPDLLPAPWQQSTDAVFFQAPMDSSRDAQNAGLEGTLNICGFFVSFGSDDSEIPSFLGPELVTRQNRYRLYRMVQPTEGSTVYDTQNRSWFENPLHGISTASAARAAGVYPLAENIIALVILPKYALEGNGDELASDFRYDSRLQNWTAGDQPEQMHQLPPLLEVVMVAIDETSAARLLRGVTTETSAAAALGIDPHSLFKQASNLEADLKSLGDALAAKGVGYRAFRTTIPLRSGKWNRQTAQR